MSGLIGFLVPTNCNTCIHYDRYFKRCMLFAKFNVLTGDIEYQSAKEARLILCRGEFYRRKNVPPKPK